MTERHRIIHLIDGLTVGGAEMMLYRLVTRMDARYFENSVVTFLDKGPVGEMLEHAGIRVYALGMQQGHPSLSALLRLLGILRTTRPQLVQSWMYLANLLAAILAPLLPDTRIIWNIRSSTFLPESASRMTRWVRRGCVNYSRIPEAVIVNSQTGMRAHQSLGYRPRSWMLLPNGFDTDTFIPNPLHRTSLRQEFGLHEDQPLLGIIGRYHPVKDQQTFLHAAHLLHAKIPQAHFLLVGDGISTDNSLLTAAIPDNAFRAVVHLLGRRDDIPRILAGIDILSLTSLAEGFPNVIGEAMCCGVPCVATETAGDAPMIIGDTGIIVPAQSPAALVAAWECLLQEGEERRAQRGRQARERILAHYDITNVVRTYETVYTAILANAHGSKWHGTDPTPRANIGRQRKG